MNKHFALKSCMMSILVKYFLLHKEIQIEWILWHKRRNFPIFCTIYWLLCVGAFEWMKSITYGGSTQDELWLFEWEKRKIIDFHFHFHWAVVTFKILWLWPWYAICSWAKRRQETIEYLLKMQSRFLLRLHNIQMIFNIFVASKLVM